MAAWGTCQSSLSFVHKRFDGYMAKLREMDDADCKLLARVESRFETIGELYAAYKSRAALGKALARQANGPWAGSQAPSEIPPS